MQRGALRVCRLTPSLNPVITFYDYGIIAFYLFFVLAIGVVFRRLSKDTSDYFRAGGAMPWWITGTSAWVATFSAWAFVGAASEIYRSGLKVLMLFYAAIPALVLVGWITCVRFRRLRVVTWMEAVRERFGPGSEQFYTWIKVPIELIKAGIGLMAISVFIAAVLHVPINSVILVLGITITLVAFTGGAFAVLASDFVQMFLVMTITLVTLLLTVRQPEIGGLSGLIAKVNAAHPEHFRWWLAMRPTIVFGWGLAFAWIKTAELNSMEYSTMYLMAKSEKHARRMVAIPLLGGLVGPLVWVVPPLAATLMFPDLAQVFPQLAKPSEGAFVAVALKVLPVGLIGLLMCAMFGATLTQMDAGVNKAVGVFVRSFYLPMLRPQATEQHLLRASKVCTLAFGAIIIALSLVINTNRQTDVFTLLNQFMVSLGFPLTIPIFFGLFFKKTPGWSAWVTALAGFAFSAWANFSLAQRLGDPAFVRELPGMFHAMLGGADTPLTSAERGDLLLVVTAVGTSLVGTVIFFGSALFYRKSSSADRARSDALFVKFRQPVLEEETAHANDEPVYRLLGALCLVYGAFIALLALIPNALHGRLSFLGIGAILGGAGFTLWQISVRKRRARQS